MSKTLLEMNIRERFKKENYKVANNSSNSKRLIDYFDTQRLLFSPKKIQKYLPEIMV
jgi:hypothetical protein